MYSGDSVIPVGDRTVAGDISIPLALKTLEHSELYSRRKINFHVENCGPMDMSRSMADTLCDYDTLESSSCSGSSDCLLLPPALPLKNSRLSGVVHAQFR